MSTVGERIKSIRLNLGLSTEKFATLFNPPASKGTVSKWENGRYLPNNTRLKRIAELGHISVDELISKPQTKNYSVGKRIKGIRTDKGMTMKEFGECVTTGLNEDVVISDSIVSRWESGKSLPNAKRIRLIAELGNVTTEQLLYGNPLSQHSTKELLEELLRREEVVH